MFVEQNQQIKLNNIEKPKLKCIHTSEVIWKIFSFVFSAPLIDQSIETIRECFIQFYASALPVFIRTHYIQTIF